MCIAVTHIQSKTHTKCTFKHGYDTRPLRTWGPLFRPALIVLNRTSPRMALIYAESRDMELCTVQIEQVCSVPSCYQQRQMSATWQALCPNYGIRASLALLLLNAGTGVGGPRSIDGSLNDDGGHFDIAASEPPAAPEGRPDPGCTELELDRAARRQQQRRTLESTSRMPAEAPLGRVRSAGGCGATQPRKDPQSDRNTCGGLARRMRICCGCRPGGHGTEPMLLSLYSLPLARDTTTYGNSGGALPSNRSGAAATRQEAAMCLMVVAKVLAHA